MSRPSSASSTRAWSSPEATSAGPECWLPLIDSDTSPIIGTSLRSPVSITSVKMLPLPSSLSTRMSPPSSVARRLEMASPRPVPPKRRVVELSPCEKAWNRRFS